MANKQHSIWTLLQEYDEIYYELYEAGGELTPELEARLDAVNDALPLKIENMCHVIYEAESEAAKAEKLIAGLSERKRRYSKTAKRLRQWVAYAMWKANLKKIACEYFEPRLRQNPPRIDLIKPEFIPEEIQRRTIKVELDKIKALELVKEKYGKELENLPDRGSVTLPELNLIISRDVSVKL